jgi:hypothetical protein
MNLAPSPSTPTGRDGASTNTPVVLTTFFFSVDSRAWLQTVFWVLACGSKLLPEGSWP